MSKRVKLFGSSLDPLDGRERVELKRAYVEALRAGRDMGRIFLDPYDGICGADHSLFEGMCVDAGRVPVETWLTPRPLCGDLSRLTSENYRAFLEGNGCKRYSEITGHFVDALLPGPLVMVGVDHSQTGGVLLRLSERYGPAQISVIVLDAHTDMFDFDLLYETQKRLMSREGGIALPWEREVYSNDFYSCGNFLRVLLEERAILPENLFLIGVTDSPSHSMGDEIDPDLKGYIDAYESVIRQGVHVVSKTDVESSFDIVAGVLSQVKTAFAYVSIDMDVGVNASTFAVRFPNTIGIKEHLIYGVVKTISEMMTRGGLRCLGIDLMEIDVHFAGYCTGGVRDRSYEIASNIIRILLPNLQSAVA